MDHAEVLERLDEAFVGPGKIWSLEATGGAEDVALRDHLVGCAACRREYDALVATAATLAMGAPATLRPSEAARARLLATVQELGFARGLRQGGGAADSPGSAVVTRAGAHIAGSVTRDADSTARTAHGASAASVVRGGGGWGADPAPVSLMARRRRTGILAGLAVAAALVLLVAGAFLGRLSGPASETAVDEVRQLAALSSSMDRLLADPGHRETRLRTAGDVDGGTVLVSSDRKELLVVSTSLRDPTDDRRYWCFLDRDGTRTSLGWMHFSDALAYWVGPVKGPADLGRPGDRFEVVLERSDSPELRGTF